MDIGGNVRKYREMRGFSLSELAEKADVSKAFLWEIERGNSKRPGAEILFKIATALDVALADLMGKRQPETVRDTVEPEINEGLREFIDERKRQGNPLTPEEIKSLSYVQFRGGRPQTRGQWELVYAALKESTRDADG